MDGFFLLVGFHHERGNEVEWSYPCENPFKSEKEKLSNLEFLAMPDQVHNSERDFVYFVFGDFFVVGCYEQIAASKVKEKSVDVTRATIQKSLCYFTKNFNYSPLGLSYIRARIQDFFHAYFEQAQQGSFANKAILESLHKDMPQILATATSTTVDIPDHKYLKSSPVLRLLSRFGRTVLSLLKLMLLEKRVFVYGLPIGETSDLVVALTSLLPLFNEKRGVIAFIHEGSAYEAPPLPSVGLNRGASSIPWVAQPIEYGPEEQEYAKLRLPLRVASYSFISGHVVLNQSDWLSALPSYFVATSNALLPMHRHVLELDASFDANTARLVLHSPSLEQALKLTPEDAAFVDFVASKIQADEPNDPFAEFVVLDESAPDHASYTPGTTAAWQSKEAWVRTMFAGYLKALLASVSAHLNGAAAGRFNGHFLALWEETRNYRAWSAQIDVRALHADPTYNDLNHPGLTLPQTPNSLVGKSFHTVKGSLSSVKDSVSGSLSSLSATTSHFVSAINSAWNARTNMSDNDNGEWGLDAHLSASRSASSTKPSTAQPSNAQAPGAQPSKPINNQSSLNTSTPPATPSTPPPASQTSQATTRTPSFFESMKQKIASPFGRTERAERTAAQFEQMSLDGSPPTVIQPAQLAHTAPSNPNTPAKPEDSDDDLLGF